MSLSDSVNRARVYVASKVVGTDLRQLATSEATLRAMYSTENAKNLVPGETYRLHSENGLCMGFQYVCVCGTDYKVIGQMQFLEKFVCLACKKELRISDIVGITKEGIVKDEFRDVSKWAAEFAKLKVRPFLLNNRAPRIVDTWGAPDTNPGESVYGWDGDKDAADRTDINRGLW